MRSRSGSLFYAERSPEKVIEETGSASLRDFPGSSLEAMATIYPVTLEELQNIPGVGAGKAKRYGEEFCKLIKRHCEEMRLNVRRTYGYALSPTSRR